MIFAFFEKKVIFGWIFFGDFSGRQGGREGAAEWCGGRQPSAGHRTLARFFDFFDFCLIKFSLFFLAR